MAHKEAKDAQLTLLIYSKLGLSNILLINFNLMLETTAICLYFIKIQGCTKNSSLNYFPSLKTASY